MTSALTNKFVVMFCPPYISPADGGNLIFSFPVHGEGRDGANHYKFSCQCTREHLETYTREELIELILQLQDKVAELEARLASKNRPPKTSSNSSVPPSSDRKGNSQNTKKNKKKKRGAKSCPRRF